ncbi:MAG TPA: hypothetical protein VNO26_12465 [Candidatus Limnocylindria bacterium]|nr:hypothetical protein [Candidatus Limnocylindria bacterium]
MRATSREKAGNPAARRRRRPRLAVLAVGLLAVAAGCVEVDGRLQPNGALELRYTYIPPRHATVKSETARLSSPHVRVERLERDQSLPDFPPGEFTTAVLAVDDARKLSTAPAFAAVRIDADLGAGRLAVSLPGMEASARERARTSTDAGVERRALRVTLQLPGSVIETEPPASVSGERATWTFTVREVAALGETVALAVRWTPPAGS